MDREGMEEVLCSYKEFLVRVSPRHRCDGFLWSGKGGGGGGGGGRERERESQHNEHFHSLLNYNSVLSVNNYLA